MFKKILVPIDIESESTNAKSVATAAQLAKAGGAELHFIAVVPPFGMSIVGSFFPEDAEQKMMEKAKDKLAEFASNADLGGLIPQLHCARGTIYEEIIAAANSISADLIVMTAHRDGLSDYLLGPNAARVARHSKQSVMIIRD